MVVEAPSIHPELNVILNPHPIGCALNIKKQREFAQKFFQDHPVQVPDHFLSLICGISSGYGLASAIALLEAGSSSSVRGICRFDKPARMRKGELYASASYYNALALADLYPDRLKIYAGDAFQDETRNFVLSQLAQENLKIKALIYSVVTTQRHYNGQIYVSEPLALQTDLYGNDLTLEGEIKNVHVMVATPEEIQGTIGVMGGEDLKIWFQTIKDREFFAETPQVHAFGGYLGSESKVEALNRIYPEGSIGQAKVHLFKILKQIHQDLTPLKGEAYLDVLPFGYTPAGFHIPFITAYASLLEAVNGSPQELIEVACALVYSMFQNPEYRQNLCDIPQRTRFDLSEFLPAIQAPLFEQWEILQRLEMEQELPSIIKKGVLMTRKRFCQVYGFEVEGIDYSTPTYIDPAIPENILSSKK